MLWLQLLLIYVLPYDCAGGYDCLLESKLSLHFEQMWQHSNISSKTCRAPQFEMLWPNFTFRQMTIPCNKCISQVLTLLMYLFFMFQLFSHLTIIGNFHYQNNCFIPFVISFLIQLSEWIWFLKIKFLEIFTNK
jgi:hypothetical protein